MSSAKNVVIGRYAAREFVQETYRPRGKRLGKTQSNQLLLDQILPLCHEKAGVPWIEEERLVAKLKSLPTTISTTRAVSGRAGGSAKVKKSGA